MTETKVRGYRIKKPSHYSIHSKSGYSVRNRIWFEKDGELYIVGNRVALLERIDEFGSIAEAARSMQLAYRNAWLWVESMNRLAPSPLVEKITGGPGGGHARITEEGRKVITKFKELNDKVRELLRISL
jgi:molybdate transport system regulatory protein